MSDSSNSDNSLFEGVKKLKIKGKKNRTVRFNNFSNNRSKQRVRKSYRKVPMGHQNINSRKSHKKGSFNVPDDLTEEEKEILLNSMKRFKLTKKERVEMMYLYLDYLKQKRDFNKLNNSTYYLTSEEKDFLKTLMG
jgi:hypothetical protein